MWRRCCNRTRFGFDFTKRIVCLFNNAVGGEPFLGRGHSLNHGFLNHSLFNNAVDTKTTPNQTKPRPTSPRPSSPHPTSPRPTSPDWWIWLHEFDLSKPIYEYDVFSGTFVLTQDQKTTAHQTKSRPAAASLWQKIESQDKEVVKFLETPFYSWETIPFTKRKHFVISTFFERLLVPRIRHGNGEKTLPPTQPVSVRLNLVARKIIASLYQLLEKRQVPNDPVFEGTMNKLKESLNWEVVVLYDNRIRAYCHYGGQIFLYTGMLNHLRSEAEVAFIIAHEIAHILARHTAETLAVVPSLLLAWMCITQLVMSRSIIPLDMSLIISLYSYRLIGLYLVRKKEFEADYIALLLMAGAGYDPRVAPPVIERLGSMNKNQASWRAFFCTHPCAKKRAQCMTKPKVMEEALLIYRESQARKGGQGSL